METNHTASISALNIEIARIGAERAALTRERLSLLSGVVGEPSSASKVRKINEKIGALDSDLKTLDDALESEVTKAAEALRLQRAQQSQDVRERAVRGAVQLVNHGRKVDVAADRLVEALLDLRKAAGPVSDDFRKGLAGLISDAPTSDAMCVGYPHASAASQDIGAAFATIVSRIAATTSADLSAGFTINRWGPPPRTFQTALREGSRQVAARLELDLAALKDDGETHQ